MYLDMGFREEKFDFVWTAFLYGIIMEFYFFLFLIKNTHKNYNTLLYIDLEGLREVKIYEILCEVPSYNWVTNSMAYGTRRFNAAFTRALQ